MKSPPTVTRRLAIAGAVAWAMLLAAGLTHAQPHAGGVLVGDGYPNNSTSYLNGLFRAQRNGQLSTFVDTFTASRPNYMHFTMMDNDNKSVVFASRASTSPIFSTAYGIFRYDPSVSQFQTISRSTVAFRTIYGLTPAGDGNWYTAAQSLINNRFENIIYKVGNNGTIQTVLTTVQLGHSQTFNYPIGTDVSTGGLLIPSGRSVGFFSRPVYHVANDGTITTWNTSNNGPAPTYGWTQEIATGDMLYIQSRQLYRASAGRTSTSSRTIPTILDSVYGAIFENQSTPSPQLITYGYRQLTTLTVCNLHWVDPATANVTNTTQFFQSNSRAMIPYPFATMTHDRARYVVPVRTGGGKWDLKLSAPAFAGKRYVLAVGASGIRPGFAAAGLKFWLNVDPLAIASAQDLLRPVWNPGPKVLDANGEATGKIDVSAFGTNLGLRVHVLLVVVDPNAPGGIGLVTEPVTIWL